MPAVKGTLKDLEAYLPGDDNATLNKFAKFVSGKEGNDDCMLPAADDHTKLVCFDHRELYIRWGSVPQLERVNFLKAIRLAVSQEQARRIEIEDFPWSPDGKQKRTLVIEMDKYRSVYGCNGMICLDIK